MTKLLAVVWKEIQETFTDRNLILIMIAAPLAIASIVGLAFGGLGRGESSPIEHIPVAIVNADDPQGLSIGYGQILSDLLTTGEVPAEEREMLSSCSDVSQEDPDSEQLTGLDTLIDGEMLDQARVRMLVESGEIELPQPGTSSPDEILAAGRAAVDRGVYSALVFIPPGFSASLNSLAALPLEGEGATVDVYGNRGQGLAPGIVLSVVESILGQLEGGSITVGATIAEIAATDRAMLADLDPDQFETLASCAFSPSTNTVGFQVVPVQAVAESNAAGSILVAVGSAQAMFFALFTGQFGILSLYEDRKNWTLQRLIASPTPRWVILSGKLLGVMGTVVFQLVILVLALTVVGSLLSGTPTMIWGDDWLALSGLLLAASTAVGGISMFLAGILKSVEQANIVVSLVNMAMAVLGGAFGFSIPMPFAAVSLIYWGREAFQHLAAGNSEIGLHLAVLSAQGILMFVIGLILFDRRFEVGG